MFLGQILLFQSLDLGLELIDELVSLISLGAEGDHALKLIPDMLEKLPVRK